MAVTKEKIKQWLSFAKKHGATHLLVVCDTWDYEDYPVEVKKGEDVRRIYEAHNGPNMQTVMEVYNLSLDFETQLNQDRSMNFDSYMEFTGEPFLK